MDAVTATDQMTAAEFLAIGEDPNGRRSQLIDGELVMNEPTWMHNGAQGAIFLGLGAWVRAGTARGRIGLPLDVELDARNVYAPDVVWYADGRAPALRDPPPYPMPDIAVEVRSRSTWRFDIGAKKAAYERHRLAELWLVDTAADVVLVYRRSMPDAASFDVSLELTIEDTLISPLLPGFALPVREIFAAES